MTQRASFEEDTTFVSLRMPHSIFSWLNGAAKNNRRSRSGQILKMIEDHPDYQAHLVENKSSLKSA